MLRQTTYSFVLTHLTLIGFLGSAAANADTLSQITSPAAQKTTDSIYWSSIGGDQTLLNAGGSVSTAKGATAQVTLAGPNAILSRVCSTSPCSWTGVGFPAGDTLLWTSDAGNGSTGPVRVTFKSGMAGGGAYIQANGPGTFIAKIEAFNGGTSLGYFFATSNSQGNPVYMGVLNQSGPNVTSIVFSLTSVSAGMTTDFGLDSVNISSASAAPAVSLTPTSLNFGNQLIWTTSAPQQVTLKNVGNAALAISSIVANGDFKQTNNCPSSVAVSASCVITATFFPSATGVRTGLIVVSSNAKGSPQTVNLTGTGTAPAVSLSRTSVTFPSQRLNTQSSVQAVTLTNTGTGPLIISSIFASGDFKQTNNCVSPVVAHASCTISITFTPTAIGNRTGTVTITDKAAGSPHNIRLSGVGTH